MAGDQEEARIMIAETLAWIWRQLPEVRLLEQRIEHLDDAIARLEAVADRLESRPPLEERATAEKRCSTCASLTGSHGDDSWHCKLGSYGGRITSPGTTLCQHWCRWPKPGDSFGGAA